MADLTQSPLDEFAQPQQPKTVEVSPLDEFTQPSKMASSPLDEFISTQPQPSPLDEFSPKSASPIGDKQSPAMLEQMGLTEGGQKTLRGWLANVAVNVADGAMFGGGGEVTAALNATLDKLGGTTSKTWTDAYYSRQKEFDQLQEALAEKYGKGTMIAGQLAGGLMTGGAAVKLAANAKHAMVAAVTAEAALGALGGLAMSEHKLTDEDKTGLVKDMALWAGVGGGLPVLFKGMGFASKAIGAKANKAAAEWLADGIGQRAGMELDEGIAASRFAARHDEELLERWILGDKGQAPWLNSSHDLAQAIDDAERADLKRALFPKARQQHDNALAKSEVKEVSEDAVAQIGNDIPEFSIHEIVSDEDLLKAMLAKRSEFGAQAFGSKVMSSNPVEASTQLGERLAKEGADFADVAWDQYRNYEHGVKFLRDNLISQSSGWAPKILRRTAMFLADARYVFQAIDDRWGTSLAQTHAKLTKAHDLTTIMTAGVAERVKELSKEAKKLGLIAEDSFTHSTPHPSNPDQIVQRTVTASKLFHAITSPEYRNGLSEAERAAVAKWTNLIEELRLEGRKHGLDIKQLPDYLPMHAKNLPEFVSEIRQRAPKDWLTMTEEQFADLLQGKEELTKNKGRVRLGGEKFGGEFTDLLQALEVVERRPIKTVKGFKAAMAHVNDFDRLRESMYSAASATFERTDVPLPGWARETDVGKLITSWAGNTFKYAYSREPLAEIRSAQQMFAKSTMRGVQADANAASYLDNFIKDMSGTRGSTFSGKSQNVIEGLKAELKTHADQAQGASKYAWQLAYNTDKLFTTMMQQIYANYLGWSIRSIVRNMTQVPLLTAQEVAGVGGGVGARFGRQLWAQKEALAATAEVANIMTVGTKMKLSPELAYKLGRQPGEEIVTRDLAKLVQNLGIGPSQFVGEAAVRAESADAVAKGISSVTGAVGEAVKAQADWALKLYGWTDYANRAVSFVMAKRLTEHAVDALEAAAKGERFTTSMENTVAFIKGMPVSWQRRLKAGLGHASEGLRQGKVDPESYRLIAQTIGDYLVTSTQFSYSRAAMSEYGRTMGQFFSMFTKWPLSMSSSMVQTFRQAEARGQGKVGGLAENLNKYFAPLAALTAADAIFLQDSKGERSDTTKMLTGSAGLWQWAPGASAIDLATGKTFKVPALDLVGTMGDLIYSNNDAKYGKALEKAFRSYVPGVSYLRFMTEDLPTLTEGENPRGISELLGTRREQ